MHYLVDVRVSFIVINIFTIEKEQRRELKVKSSCYHPELLLKKKFKNNLEQS